MKTIKYIPFLLAVSLFCSSQLIGCKPEASTPSTGQNPVETSETISAETSIQETITEKAPVQEAVTEEASPEINTVLITFNVINNCGVDIGMFSVIDPVTQEQINAGSIANGEALSLESNWPIGVTDFQWAVYNMNGELYSEATTDISQAKSSVIITLEGNGSIDTINTTFE